MTQQEAQYVIDTIDALGVALADEGHTWSPELRAMYENAIRLLTRIAEVNEPVGSFRVPETHWGTYA